MAEKRPVTTLLIGLGGSGAWTVAHVKRQLFDAYDNRIPENVALAVLDTAKTVIVSVGSGADNVVREPGMGIGATTLDRSEIAHVGGDSYDLVREIDQTDNYAHIKSWFLSSQFLRDLPKPMFALDQGAGQFRQFGRLALFRDVMAPATSSVAGIIDTKLRQLATRRRPDDPSISVVITGSLAGGTGAGLFIDIAHLVQQVATINNIGITLRGFFYLPQAFRSTLSQNELDPARARAFAALRELKRFILNSDYQYGYPMYYHSPRSGVNQQLWRGANTGKLYDFVYLIDGEGATKMNSRKLELGSAPSVADAIVSFMDENYGPEHEQYIINTRGKITDRQSETGKKAFISTLGSYSIILPIQQIIEGWAYRLSRELLLKIVPAAAYNERGYITEISARHNPEHATGTVREELQRLTKTNAPVTDHRDPASRRQLMPLPLWGKVYDIYTSPDKEQAMLKRLGELQLVDWLEMLAPPQTQTDPEVMRVLTQTSKVLQDDVSDHADTSDERDKGDPSKDWLDIKQKSERFINTQLGMPAQGGGRQGGIYREALDRLTEMQVQRFREYMASFLHRELNGEARRDILTAKVGKLGWLTAVFEEFKTMLATVNQYLDRIRAGGTASSNRRAAVEETLIAELRNMQEKKDERGFFGRKGPAIDAQRAYIDAVREYVNYYRMEFARDEVGRTLTRLIAFTDEVLAEFNLWKRILATEVESLHNKLLDGGNTVKSDRQKAADVANHRIINDAAWEEQRYNAYVSGEVRERLFQSWQWRTDLIPDGSRQRFSLVAGLQNDRAEIEEFQRDVHRNASKWAASNLALIMEHTRRFFRDAIRQESLVEYLMNEKDARQLAEELNRNSGYLLSFTINQQTGAMIPGNILLAKSDDNLPQQREYLREVLYNVAAGKNQGDIRGQDNPLQKTASCADPFRLTLLSTAELIPMEGVSAYADCERKYWEIPYDTRQKNHIFPAEVHSVEYERDLTLLEQKPRILTDRVALLLEDEERFKQFLFLLTHRLIEQRETGDRDIKFYWALLAPSPDPRRRGQIEEWKLSDTTSEAPSLMEAAVRYIVVGRDYDNEARAVPYDHILKALVAAQEADTADRIQRDEIALQDGELRGWYEQFLPPLDEQGQEDLSNWTEEDDRLYLDVSKLIVRHDMMQELVEDFKSYVRQLGMDAKEAQNKANNAQSHNEALLKQELYDLFSISTIALEKEIFKYRGLVKNRYDVKTSGKRSRKLS